MVLLGSIIILSILILFTKGNILLGSIFIIIQLILITFATKKLFHLQKLLENIFSKLENNDIDFTEYEDKYPSLKRLFGFFNKISQIVSIINYSSKNLKELSNHLTKETEEIIKGSNENTDNLLALENKTKDILDSVTNQYASTEEISATINNLSESFKIVAENAEQTMILSNDTAKAAKKGGKSVTKTLNEMRKIETLMQIIETKTNELASSSEKIVNIVNMINQISEQTNLLALNAAIEAARAGEAGKGFAVVAEEVRKLADDSGKATKEIEDLIKIIQNETNEVINAVQESYNEVKVGIKLSEDTIKEIDNIVEQTESTNKEVTNISNAINQQSTAIEEIQVATETVAFNGETITNISQEQTYIFEIISNKLNEFLEEISRLNEISHSLTGSINGIAILDNNNQIQDLIKWDNKYSVNNEKIDNQHKKLVTLVNTLNAAMLLGQSKSIINEIIAELADYTVTHFKDEEEYMESIGYDDLENHKKIHKTFVEQVVKVQNDIKSGKSSVSNELIDFLKKWLIEHIMKTDKKYVK
ncbi:methyl-accepting chemotaxis protein [Hypnocyclicus thermotrophus]|uniref:Methyl-accepting chemotaxis protein n=1 Tax=Hypnocyclicus thermotrophus TaxID=1627895 RepID=A0AA46I507_9FUSO|nr:bacteriohemerythrin [Hypnocyclicus thermotrophus]TDT68028.1 methyl-accepting chemotaxis protein [Hypnocyclicus thermotrophus]